MFSEIRVATVGVGDLERSQEFYCATFDYAVLGTGTVSGPAAGQLWGLPEGMSAETVLLGPAGATSGLLRLVQFDRPGELYWGDYSRMQDYGHYALNVRVPEIQSAVAAIRAHGGSSRSGPTHWTVTPDLSAWDSLSYDPDRVLLDVFELEPAPGSLLAEYDGRPSPLQTVAIHSSDARRSALFYAALGMRPLYDKVLREMESFFGLPAGTELHNINMMNPAAPDLGRLEIAQYVGFPGRSQRDRAVPPALGILSAALETDDLAAAELLLQAIGAEPAGERVELDLPGLGTVATRSYFGPDDERLEFYERR
ncbi:VOC family protein [Nocardioides pantholopis]|uniref:VOC family protein n=1 Tax=Nocardioides pantholopis TaxID=2483798 RepID=UPI0013DD90D7|nr:VOC family protein [Nocardioides pantholopis]